MSEIFVPPVIQQQDAVIEFIEAVEKLLDPVKRQEAVNEIAAFHKLNDTEAKKAEEARQLIAEHAAVLKQTQELVAKHADNLQEVADKRKETEEYVAAELAKISSYKDEADLLMKKAVAIRDRQAGIDEELTRRDKLIGDKETAHESKLAGLEEYEQHLNAYKKELDDKAIENETVTKAIEEKLATLRKSNF